MQQQHKTRNTIIVLSILALAGVGVYVVIKKLFPKDVVTKSAMVEYIIAHSGGQGSYDGLMGLGDEYISAWYLSVKEKRTTFMLAGKTFSSITGKQLS